MGRTASLKDIFHYHLINAQGSITEVEQNIVGELEYQSSLELDPRTYDRLRTLPLASEIVVHARQELVRRLDSYELGQPELFQRVANLIDKKIMPIVKRHALSGHANINSEDPVLTESDALAMFIDIFSERGYHAVVDVHRHRSPGIVRPRHRQDHLPREEGLSHDHPLQGLRDSSRLKPQGQFDWLRSGRRPDLLEPQRLDRVEEAAFHADKTEANADPGANDQPDGHPEPGNDSGRVHGEGQDVATAYPQRDPEQAAEQRDHHRLEQKLEENALSCARRSIFGCQSLSCARSRSRA